jgi:hypothetical protein
MYCGDNCNHTGPHRYPPPEGYSWSSSTPVLTHCQHGLDLRINPRCYLCRPEAASLDGLREAAQRLVDAPKTARYVEGTGLWKDIEALSAALREGETK